MTFGIIYRYGDAHTGKHRQTFYSRSQTLATNQQLVSRKPHCREMLHIFIRTTSTTLFKCVRQVSNNRISHNPLMNVKKQDTC